jgi:type I restriction enzyme S subunit
MVTADAGFRLTEAGPLPSDWDVRTLGSCLMSQPRYGINAPAVAFSDDLPAYLRITDISPEGRFVPDPPVSVADRRSLAYLLSDGDLVFARTGASVGKSYLYEPADGVLSFAGYLIRVQPNPKCLLPAFLASYLRTARYWDWVRLMSVRSGQPGINALEYAQLPIPVPSVDEQRAIANVLADFTESEQALVCAIDKKRKLRTALVQELMTGNLRLPGFDDDWSPTSLGHLGAFSKGTGVRKDEVTAEGLPCVRYGEIYTHHTDLVRTFNSFISRSVAAGSHRLSKGDLLFAGSGETAEEIGKCVVYLGDGEAYAGSDIVILSPIRGDPLFLAYLLNQNQAVRQKTRLGQGDAVVHISARALAQIEVSLPSVDEQRAISAMISDIDEEIIALATQSTKTADLKTAVAQELLSGRTRLA